MDKVTYFDIEYANCKNKSICQIGIMCEDFSNSKPYYPELDLYINPEDGFDDNCTKQYISAIQQNIAHFRDGTLHKLRNFDI